MIELGCSGILILSTLSKYVNVIIRITFDLVIFDLSTLDLDCPSVHSTHRYKDLLSSECLNCFYQCWPFYTLMLSSFDSFNIWTNSYCDIFRNQCSKNVMRMFAERISTDIFTNVQQNMFFTLAVFQNHLSL